MIDLSYYIKVSTSPSGCNSHDAEEFKCDRYLDCESCLEDKIIEHDKHIIEQYKENTKLKDTIRDIHDNVANEMYCKGIDDFVNKVELKYLGVNPDELYEKYYPTEICEQIKEIAKQLKAGIKHEI